MRQQHVAHLLPSIYKHGLVLVLVVMLVYVRVLFFPYLLLDDNLGESRVQLKLRSNLSADEVRFRALQLFNLRALNNAK